MENLPGAYKVINGRMTHKIGQGGHNYEDFMIQENSRERSRKRKNNKATLVQKIDNKVSVIL